MKRDSAPVEKIMMRRDQLSLKKGRKIKTANDLCLCFVDINSTKCLFLRSSINVLKLINENENQLRRDCFLPFWKKSKLIKISPQENNQISSYFCPCFSREQEHVKGFVILDLVHEVSLM